MERVLTVLVKDLMTPNPSVVKQDTAIEGVIDVMDKKGIEMVPVVEDDGRLIGVISRSDILKEKIMKGLSQLVEKRQLLRHWEKRRY